MINEVYLAVLYRPTAGAATGLASSSSRRRSGRLARNLPTRSTPARNWRRRSPPPWRGTSPNPWVLSHGGSGARRCSSISAADQRRRQRMPLPPGRSIRRSRPRVCCSAPKPSNTARRARRAWARCSASRSIRPRASLACTTGCCRRLSLRADAVLTFLTKATGQALLQRQFNRMANAGDFAVSQAAELKDALDALTSNEFVMGDHHFSLQVWPTSRIQRDRCCRTARLKPLNDHVALARSFLADTGMLVAREDLALEAAFWAQLPGNFPCGRARRRSPRETLRPWRRFTTTRSAARTAIIGARR